MNVFGQQPEEKIYHAIDVFVAHPSAKALQLLTQTESDFWKNTQPKTKDEFLAIVVLNCNKAYYENQFGQSENAVSSYEKACQLYQKKKLSDYDIVEYCLKPLGNLYTVLGDYDNAENTIKQYYFIANQEKNESQKFAAILNLSNVYQNSGRVNEAIEMIEKSIKTEKLSSTQKGLLLNNLGANYLLRAINEDYTNAENAFLKAVPLLIKDKTKSENLLNTYINLYRIKLLFSQNEALDYFAKANSIFEKLPQQEPRKKALFYLEKVFFLFKQKNFEEAQAELKTVYKTLLPNYRNQKNTLPDKNTLYAETTLLDAFDLQAEIYLAQNEPKEALKSYALSFYVEELLRSLLVFEDSKIITQIRNRNRTEKCLEIYQSLFEAERKTSYLETAFIFAEKTKSGVLKDYLTNAKTISRNEKLILEQLQNCNNGILKEQQKLEFANISKINEGIKKQNELMLLLKSIKEKKNTGNEISLNIKNLYAKLEKDNAVMYEYFWGSKTIHLFTIENNQIALKSICIGQMCGEPIISYVSLFYKPESIINNIENYKKTAFLAYKNLLLPKKSTYPNLIIIPDGILNFLPFEALITSPTKTTNFAKMHYLMNDFKIAYNNSASMYLNSKPNLKTEKTVLGVFPVFEKTAFELSYSKRELEAIRNNFKGKYLENSVASFSNFKKNAPHYSVLHLSTHASSGDVETPASIKFYDQEILYTELYNLNINPDLVVLSACETGIGKLFKAEGAMSVARGFQFAGAQNLLFSLWKVNDYTTSVFMTDFYKNVKKDLPYFEANTKAKIDFLNDKSIPNAKKSPYYWSSFVYYGAISSEEKTSNYIFYIISLLIVITLFLIFNHYLKWKTFTRFSKSRNTKK